MPSETSPDATGVKGLTDVIPLGEAIITLTAPSRQDDRVNQLIPYQHATCPRRHANGTDRKVIHTVGFAPD